MARAAAPGPLPTVPARPSSDARLGRNVAKWMVGFALSVGVALLLTSLTLWQMTSEGTARETLRRATAALTEIDALIARDYDDLQALAEDSAADETFRLEAYPVDVPLRADDIAGRSPAEVRATVLERSADALYARGSGELRSVSEGQGDIGVFSVPGLTENGLGFLRERNHDALMVLTLFLAGMCAVLAASLVALASGFGRLPALGAAVLAGSLPVLLGSGIVRIVAGVAGGDDAEYVRREFLDIVADLAWIGVRNGLAFAAFGAVLLLAGWGLAVAVDRRAVRRGYS
jgi:hypothetical protein